METLLTAAGAGSMIVEAALELTGLPYRCEELDFWQPGPDRDRVLALNPLAQLPVLVLADGTVLTESAAMLLHLADRAPAAGLMPAATSPLRPAFLRWLVFLVGSIYPTFTYGDVPARYVAGDGPQAELRRSTDLQRQEMWRQVEQAAAAAGPWFQGETRTVIDLYIWVMTKWRPRRDWFTAECPKLAAIAGRLDEDPALERVRRRNWP